jgi:hypothetical protein
LLSNMIRFLNIVQNIRTGHSPEHREVNLVLGISLFKGVLPK